MPSLSLHFAHRKPLEGWPLGAIWVGLIIGSWGAAYLIGRLVIAAAHALGTLLP